MLTRPRSPNPMNVVLYNCRQKMRVIRRWALLFLIALGCPQSDLVGQVPSAQESPGKGETLTVHVVDPATVSLHQLFQQADVVALVRIINGDGEHYSIDPYGDGEPIVASIYEAKVLQGFKGANAGAVLFFGPYVGYGIGSEYVVALRRSGKQLRELLSSGVADRSRLADNAPYCEIMYEGYSVMAVSYTCEIPSCDEAIEVSDEQVTLPSRLSRYPTECTTHARHFVWVRKAAFLRELAREQRRGDH